MIAVAVHDPETASFQTEGKNWFENAARGIYPEFPLDFNLLASWELSGVEEIGLLPLNMLKPDGLMTIKQENLWAGQPSIVCLVIPSIMVVMSILEALDYGLMANMNR